MIMTPTSCLLWCAALLGVSSANSCQYVLYSDEPVGADKIMTGTYCKRSNNCETATIFLISTIALLDLVDVQKTEQNVFYRAALHCMQRGIRDRKAVRLSVRRGNWLVEGRHLVTEILGQTEPVASKTAIFS